MSGIGGYMSTHAWGIYSTVPPAEGFRYEDVTARAGSPVLEWDEHYTGAVTVEAFTQLPALRAGEDGEDDRLLAACRIDGGRRTWATTDDPALLEAMAREEVVGRRGRVRPGGVLELA